jgi:predicted nucleotidyltransferase
LRPARPDLPPEVRTLISLCKADLGAVEVWLFGSRAWGDYRADSDHDLLAILPDDAPAHLETPVMAFQLRRRSRARADLFTVRVSDFLAARKTPNTLSALVAREGLRVDI